MQGHRLATSSEEDLDSTYEVKEYEGNIKMQEMSKHQNPAIRSRTDDCTEYKNTPDIQQIEYLDLNSPNNINSSCFSKTSRFSNISPPQYESGDISNSTYGQKGSNSPTKSAYHASVVNVQPSQTLSAQRCEVGLLDVPAGGPYIRSCQSDPMCNAKFSRLSSELEDAKMQIQYLEDILKMNDIEDDGSSNDADFLELEQGNIIIGFYP